MILKNIRKRLRLFSILSSFILLLPTRTSLNACSYGSEEEEVRFMLFNPSLIDNKSWWAYFYNAKFTYLDGTVAGSDDEAFLAREWMGYLKWKGEAAEAQACLFSSLSDSTLQTNSFYQALAAKPAAKSYYETARKCESLVGMPPPWDEDAASEQARKQGLNQMIRELSDLLETEADPFIKKKLAFQLVKLAYYGKDRSVFDYASSTYFSGKPNHVLDWWALHYKSMMLEREEKSDEANYLHALVYSNSTNKMYASRQWFTRARLSNALEFAQDDHERASVLVLAETVNPGRSLDGLKQITALDPEHKHLPMLVAREINKLENWLGTSRYAQGYVSLRESGGSAEQNIKSDLAYLSEVSEAIRGMTSIQKNYPEFYTLATAYLSLMDGDYTEASASLASLKPKTPEMEFQMDVLRVVIIGESKKMADPATQNEIAALFEKLIAQRERKFESQKILYSLSSYLRTTCEKQGLIYLAGLFDNFAVNKFCYTCRFDSFEYSLIRYYDQHASPPDIEKLIALYDKSSKNRLEAFLLKPYSNKYFFNDVLSVKYLREGNVKSAARALRDVPDDFWFTYQNAINNIGRDPFLENDDLLTTSSIGFYNKREILEKMVRLEDDAGRSPATRAENYFQLGNAWYNFSQHAWFMISYGQSMGWPIDHEEGRKAQKTALDFYRKALSYEQSDERRARILYMVTLLSPTQDTVRFAREYEKLSGTEFYTKKNCLTTRDLAGG